MVYGRYIELVVMGLITVYKHTNWFITGVAPPCTDLIGSLCSSSLGCFIFGVYANTVIIGIWGFDSYKMI